MTTGPVTTTSVEDERIVYARKMMSICELDLGSDPPQHDAASEETESSEHSWRILGFALKGLLAVISERDAEIARLRVAATEQE